MKYKLLIITKKGVPHPTKPKDIQISRLYTLRNNKVLGFYYGSYLLGSRYENDRKYIRKFTKKLFGKKVLSEREERVISISICKKEADKLRVSTFDDIEVITQILKKYKPELYI